MTYRRNKPRARTRPDSYLVEFRFSGFAKKKIRELAYALADNFGVRNVADHRTVPHITLAGPLSTKHERRLVGVIMDAARRHGLARFRLDGFGNFHRDVVYVKIIPSGELAEMRREVVENLKEFCHLAEHDYESDWNPHATLAMKDISGKFKEIQKFLKSWKIPDIEQQVLRVTILKNGRILCEYDLVEGRLLNRRESLDRVRFRKTVREGVDSKGRTFEPVEVKGKVFVSSDLHFDHDSIIRYCRRPFLDRHEMNEALLRNWNETVGRRDKVCYMGDMTYGRNRHEIDWWLDKLNGKISFIRGNHDRDAITKAKVVDHMVAIRYKDHDFLLMHEPYRPRNWDGWIIHGDKHNNNPDYPHVNYRNKTVNACVEMTDYAPISLDEVIARISQ